MRGLIDAWRRLRLLRRRGELQNRLDDEIRFHVDQQIEKNLRAGLPPEEARRQALIRFGGVDRARESTRDEFRAARVEDFTRDFRHGTRALLRAPGFTVVAVLTLALGIGATTAMFSVVNGVLLRPLPYPEQDRLIELVHEAPGVGIDEVLASPAVYFGYRDHSEAFESVGLWDWDGSPVTVTGAGQPESVRSVELTHEVLALLGAQPIRGRGFAEADDLPGNTPTVVISHAYWQRRFGGADPAGRTLIVDGIPREVIGVLPPSFRFFDYPADIFYPLQPVRADAVFPAGDGRGIARLKSGVTLGDANADVARMIPILDKEFGRGLDLERARFAPKLRWLKDSVVGDVTDTLWLLMGTIGLLLVIACANVASLVLVRVQSRRPELAIRTALGAGRTAIARVVFAETAVLGLAGGAAGLALAYLTLPLLLAIGGSGLPDVMAVRIDPSVVLVAVGTSLFAILLFAFMPVLHLTLPKRHLADALRGGARSASEGPEGNRVRYVLLAAQVALALVLLIGSGLMIRTFMALHQVDPGFRDPGSVQTFQLTIPAAIVPDVERPGAHDPERTLLMQHEIVDRLTAVAGVESAGFASFNDGLPLDGDGRGVSIIVEGRTGAGGLREMQAVSPGFFEAFQTPVLAGRVFDWHDVHQRRPVVMVSENLARAEWGSAGAALGKRIRPSPTSRWLDVVGVVRDVRHDGLSQPAPEMVIFPAFARNPIASFVIRSARAGTQAFLDDVRRAVWSVNANLSPAGAQTMGDLYDRSMARSTLTLQLLAITGGLALVLGLIGTYGTVSYAIAQRRREIGIRLALGARHGEVRRMFVTRALVLVSAGVVVGLGAAAGLTRLMASLLFGVSPLDPLTHVTVAVGLMAAAGLASYLSALRASALDPVEVLKGD